MSRPTTVQRSRISTATCAASCSVRTTPSTPWPRRSRCRVPAWAIRQTDRQLPVFRPDGCRQDRSGAPACLLHGHRTDPLRHVRVHGAPRRQPPDRRAAGLCRFRPGRPAHRSVTKKPHAVLLLDEIEKAHPDIYNILLQVMDHGTLTDNNGRKADFRNVAIIMTTNAGAEALQKPASASPPTSRPATRWWISNAVHAGIPQPSRRHHFLQGARQRGHPACGRQVPHAAGRPTAREKGRGHLHRCPARLAGRKGL
jgi:hypothetical protein